MLILYKNVGYGLVQMIARGLMLGKDQPVILHMLDTESAAEALHGVKMELIDSVFPLLRGMYLLLLLGGVWISSHLSNLLEIEIAAREVLFAKKVFYFV